MTIKPPLTSTAVTLGMPSLPADKADEILKNRPVEPIKPVTKETPVPAVSVSLLARSVYRECRKLRLTHNQMIDMTSEILKLLTEDIIAGRK